ncbi:YEATS-associated helix-containing protein [Labilibaculum euxinus]
MNHICILILIIVIVGAIAGLTNYLYYFYKGQIKNFYEVIKYILSGIGAATLVPLFLNMLSSSLIVNSENYNKINYFVFAGFCYVAGYFSDRFINSVGDRVLKDLESTNIKVDKAIFSARENEEKLDIIVSTDSEAKETETKVDIDLSKFQEQKKFEDDDIKTQINKIIESFLGKFKFRTSKGIARELKYNQTVVETILNGLSDQGIFKTLTDKDGNQLWALTQMGRMFGQRETSDK